MLSFFFRLDWGPLKEELEEKQVRLERGLMTICLDALTSLDWLEGVVVYLISYIVSRLSYMMVVEVTWSSMHGGGSSRTKDKVLLQVYCYGNNINITYIL